MNCPHCLSPDHHHVICNIRNLVVVLLSVAAGLLLFVLLLPVDWGGWPLRRKCLSCGHKFLEPREDPPNFDECRQCGYNLTGNTSGRCPECGWKLPRRYRAYRRKTDRRLRKESRIRAKPSLSPGSPKRQDQDG